MAWKVPLFSEDNELVWEDTPNATLIKVAREYNYEKLEQESPLLFSEWRWESQQSTDR